MRAHPLSAFIFAGDDIFLTTRDPIPFYDLCVLEFRASEVTRKATGWYLNNFGLTVCDLLCKLTFLSSLFSSQFCYFICSSSSHFPISTYPHSLFVTQMLQRSLNQRKPPREMQWRRTPSLRMTKTNLKKKQNRMKNKTKILKRMLFASQWEGSPFLFVCHFLCGNDVLMLGEFPTWSFLAQANNMMK